MSQVLLVVLLVWFGALIAGLVRPPLVLRFGRVRTRGRVLAIFGGGLLVLVILFGVTSPDVDEAAIEPATRPEVPVAVSQRPSAPSSPPVIDTTGYFPVDQALSVVERDHLGGYYWVRYEGQLLVGGRHVFAVSSSRFSEQDYYEDVVRGRTFLFYTTDVEGNIFLVGEGTLQAPKWRENPTLVLPRRLEVGKEYVVADTPIDRTILTSPGLVDVTLPSGATYRDALVVDKITQSKSAVEEYSSGFRVRTVYARGVGRVKTEYRMDPAKNGKKTEGKFEIVSYLAGVGEPELKRRELERARRKPLDVRLASVVRAFEEAGMRAEKKQTPNGPVTMIEAEGFTLALWGEGEWVEEAMVQVAIPDPEDALREQAGTLAVVRLAASLKALLGEAYYRQAMEWILNRETVRRAFASEEANWSTGFSGEMERTFGNARVSVYYIRASDGLLVTCGVTHQGASSERSGMPRSRG